MKITIGDNIRRLRRDRDVTQEQLAEAMNVSTTAVSKWERGETYPDITLLFPLAHYFKVSLDELMGYDGAKIEQEIQETLDEYSKLRYYGEYDRARKFICEAYGRFPNDCRVMSAYMWNIAGDYADNDPQVILEHKDELMSISFRLINECKDTKIRLDAYNMIAKIRHAEGNTEEALEIYRNRFPDFYQTTGQKIEQLFAKNTPEFKKQLTVNMIELADFATDKKVKELWFCTDKPVAERLDDLASLAESLGKIRETTGYDELCIPELNAFLGYAARCRVSGFEERYAEAKRLYEEVKTQAREIAKRIPEVAQYYKYKTRKDI